MEVCVLNFVVHPDVDFVHFTSFFGHKHKLITLGQLVGKQAVCSHKEQCNRLTRPLNSRLNSLSFRDYFQHYKTYHIQIKEWQENQIILVMIWPIWRPHANAQQNFLIFWEWFAI